MTRYSISCVAGGLGWDIEQIDADDAYQEHNEFTVANNDATARIVAGVSTARIRMGARPTSLRERTQRNGEQRPGSGAALAESWPEHLLHRGCRYGESPCFDPVSSRYETPSSSSNAITLVQHRAVVGFRRKGSPTHGKSGRGSR